MTLSVTIFVDGIRTLQKQAIYPVVVAISNTNKFYDSGRAHPLGESADNVAQSSSNDDQQTPASNCNRGMST